jgi:hypothetical protein
MLLANVVVAGQVDQPANRLRRGSRAGSHRVRLRGLQAAQRSRAPINNLKARRAVATFRGTINLALIRIWLGYLVP